MPDLINDFVFTNDPTLKPDEVALVFGREGDVRIAHNVEAIRATGMIPGLHRGTFLMALGALQMVHDEEAMTAAMKRAVSLFSQLEVPSPQSTQN